MVPGVQREIFYVPSEALVQAPIRGKSTDCCANTGMASSALGAFHILDYLYLVLRSEFPSAVGAQ